MACEKALGQPGASPRVVWHPATVSRQQREALNGHRAAVLWFTGLSASGKSTLAHAVEQALFERRCHTFVLDGDNVRHGLCADLGFSPADRAENLRRIGEVARLFLEAGQIVLSAFISPMRADRDAIRARFAQGDFIEIYCNAPLEVCERRDPKGMYRKARRGEIAQFTGISAPYEPPLAPELTVATGELPLAQCVGQVMRLLEARGIAPQADGLAAPRG